LSGAAKKSLRTNLARCNILLHPYGPVFPVQASRIDLARPLLVLVVIPFLSHCGNCPCWSFTNACPPARPAGTKNST
ncbi:hypothetical protein, partial [Pseudomonas aeruginosa]|uniref:hypothetical protein n=1 Tax=Pseudomonas aeruginosa TaxID=287 RepID=UPI001B35176B